MAAKTIAEKLRVSPSGKGIVINNSSEVLPEMGLPDNFHNQRLAGVFDYIHLFVTTKEMLVKEFSKMKTHLRIQGTLWISWPKSKQLGTDLNIKEVIRIGYEHMMVESTCLSVNDVWSALKFTFPKPGKTYQNSYGKHPEHNSNALLWEKRIIIKLTLVGRVTLATAPLATPPIAGSMK